MPINDEKRLIKIKTLNEICDAVRDKTESQELISIEELADIIRNIAIIENVKLNLLEAFPEFCSIGVSRK